MAHEFKISIDSSSKEEATELLRSTINLMKAVRAKVGTTEYIRIANKIAQNPSMIEKAKFFL